MKRLFRTWYFSALCLVLVMAASTAFAQDGAAPVPTPKADKLFQEQKLEEAIDAYGEVLEEYPEHPRALFFTGFAQLGLERNREAIATYRKLVDVAPFPVAYYNLACGYAKVGEKEPALKWLEVAIDNGFVDTKQMESDPDLKVLRGEVKFAELKETAQRIAFPCAYNAEYTQLDFWLGRWDVYDPNGNLIGQNTISRDLEQCVIHEHWVGSGTEGKSYSAYDAYTGKWYQMWIDNNGGITRFEGKVSDGAMVFRAEKPNPKGGTNLHRMTLIPIEEGKVAQHGELSSDGGESWVTNFKATYVPAKDDANVSPVRGDDRENVH